MPTDLQQEKKARVTVEWICYFHPCHLFQHFSPSSSFPPLMATIRGPPPEVVRSTGMKRSNVLLSCIAEVLIYFFMACGLSYVLFACHCFFCIVFCCCPWPREDLELVKGWWKETFIEIMFSSVVWIVLQAHFSGLSQPLAFWRSGCQGISALPLSHFRQSNWKGPSYIHVTPW